MCAICVAIVSHTIAYVSGFACNLLSVLYSFRVLRRDRLWFSKCSLNAAVRVCSDVGGIVNGESTEQRFYGLNIHKWPDQQLRQHSRKKNSRKPVYW